MAIFHLSTNHVSRKTGRSATASIAYRAGIKIEDERTGRIHDYSKRSGVVTSKCFTMQQGQEIKLDRVELWNKAEFAEKRKDGRTAREVIVNMPYELDEEDRETLVNNFSKHLVERYNCAVDYAIHTPDKEGDNRNHHAHILMTTRNIELDQNNKIKLTNKTYFEWEDKKLKQQELPNGSKQIKTLRKEWADVVNEKLAERGINERIDHRSHKERGLDIKPTVKEGWRVTQLERKGIKTIVGDINRQIKADNAEIKELQENITTLENLKKDFESVRQENKKTELEKLESQLSDEQKISLETARKILDTNFKNNPELLAKKHKQLNSILPKVVAGVSLATQFVV